MEAIEAAVIGDDSVLIEESRKRQSRARGYPGSDESELKLLRLASSALFISWMSFINFLGSRSFAACAHSSCQCSLSAIAIP
jgi:hypothetical protein